MWVLMTKWIVMWLNHDYNSNKCHKQKKNNVFITMSLSECFLVIIVFHQSHCFTLLLIWLENDVRMRHLSVMLNFGAALWRCDNEMFWDDSMAEMSE